jgi:pentatricopeptide repeat protein
MCSNFDLLRCYSKWGRVLAFSVVFDKMHAFSRYILGRLCLSANIWSWWSLPRGAEIRVVDARFTENCFYVTIFVIFMAMLTP